MYEPSVTAPLIIKAANIKANIKISERVYLQDIVPTLFDMLNLKNEDSTDFESLFPLITKTGKARNSIYLAMFDDQRGIISEDKKLIIYPKTGDLELYDLEKDPWETNNMISNQKTKSTILKLLKELKAWQEKTGDETDLSAIYKQYF